MQIVHANYILILYQTQVAAIENSQIGLKSLRLFSPDSSYRVGIGVI